MRYIGIDLGDRRTGIALGDAITGLASPMAQIEVSIETRAGEALLDAIQKEIDDLVGRGPAELVVGLPLNMDGTEGPRAKSVRAFGNRIGERTGRVVRWYDERQSSMLADAKMAQSGLTHGQKKSRRDAIAAATILQRFLDRLSDTPSLEHHDSEAGESE